jgi:hypothetical protein
MSRRGRRTAAQATPIASAAQLGRHGVLRARIWAAPRLDRTGQALEFQVAPRVAAVLSATARRIEPVEPKRRRWPLVAGGLVVAAGLSATAAFLLSRRGSEAVPMSQPDEPYRPATTAGGLHEPAREATGSDVNGRVHTS